MKKGMLKREVLMPFIFMSCLLCGCATTLTPAQKTIWAVNVYKAQYDLYLEQVINPSVTADQKAMLKKEPSLIQGEYLNPKLSDAQRQVLRVKKEILNEMKPLVKMAIEFQKSGTLPPAEIQEKLTDLINRLISIVET